MTQDESSDMAARTAADRPEPAKEGDAAEHLAWLNEQDRVSRAERSRAERLMPHESDGATVEGSDPSHPGPVPVRDDPLSGGELSRGAGLPASDADPRVMDLAVRLRLSSLASALATWVQRDGDGTAAQRQAARDALSMIDAAVAELYRIRDRVMQQIGADDDAAGARNDAVAAKVRKDLRRAGQE